MENENLEDKTKSAKKSNLTEEKELEDKKELESQEDENPEDKTETDKKSNLNDEIGLEDKEFESKEEPDKPSDLSNHNYELIDNVYYYTDVSSGIRYKYDDVKGNWVESTSSSKSETVDYSKVTTDKEGRQYYWADGMYLCRDPEEHIFFMDENNEWKPWSEKPSTIEKKTNENHWYFYKGDNTFYRDNSSNKVYKLKKDTNEWEEYKKKKRKRMPQNEDEEFDTDDDEESVSSEEEGDGDSPPGSQTDPSISYDGNIYTKLDPSDNMTYEWDPSKRAWFPKLDEDFMATYQLSYGFNPDGTKNENPLKFDDDEEEENKRLEEEEKKQKAKKEKEEKPKAGWFNVDDAHNLKVYVTNLPTDMTEESFVEFMSKCGLVCKDVSTQKFKVKLYNDEEGKFKGDALCTYIKIESVDLALQILDGYRLGKNVVSVERAKFTLKGEYNPALKPKKRRKKEVEKMQKKQEKLFAWLPDNVRGMRMKHENIAIFRNVFDPKEFEDAAEKILVHKEAIRAQAETFGAVKKVELFDRHPEGVLKITFVEVESADMCVATLNNRLYLRRKLLVETWDGSTKYNVEETEEQRKERIRKWDEFLEGKQS